MMVVMLLKARIKANHELSGFAPELIGTERALEVSVMVVFKLN
jgi:hypothetical protein